MDRTGIIVVSICVVLFFAWFVEEQKYQAHLPPPQLATNTVADAQTTSGSPALSTPENSAQIFDTNTPEDLITVTNADARYTFTSRGGGLKSVELVKYPDTVSARWKKEMATNGVATLNTHAPVPVLAILGDASFVGDGNFTLTKTGDGVRAEKAFAGWFDSHEGISCQLELSRQCEREFDQHFREAARAARAGMGRRHGHADGAG